MNSKLGLALLIMCIEGILMSLVMKMISNEFKFKNIKESIRNGVLVFFVILALNVVAFNTDIMVLEMIRRDGIYVSMISILVIPISFTITDICVGLFWSKRKKV